MIELAVDAYRSLRMSFDPREVVRYQEGGTASSGYGPTVIVTFRDGGSVTFSTSYATFKRLMEQAEEARDEQR